MRRTLWDYVQIVFLTFLFTWLTLTVITAVVKTIKTGGGHYGVEESSMR